MNVVIDRTFVKPQFDTGIQEWKKDEFALRGKNLLISILRLQLDDFIFIIDVNFGVLLGGKLFY